MRFFFILWADSGRVKENKEIEKGYLHEKKGIAARLADIGPNMIPY